MRLEDLPKKYPLLFSHEEGSLEPFTLFGFECGEGWFDIIEGACRCIMSKHFSEKQHLKYLESSLNDTETYLKGVRSYYKDNTDEQILQKLKDDLELHSLSLKTIESCLPRFAQIKEKFGTLRMYYSGGDERTDAITSFAELMSATTCEVCGNRGSTRRTGWHKTVCDEHTKQVERQG